MWSELSQLEPHMLSVAPEELADTLICATVALMGDEPIGFAGVFPARTRSGEKIWRSGKQMVEFGSAVVAKNWRGHHIGRQMLLIRQDYILSAGYLGVCVTTNPVVQTLLASSGWQMSSDHQLCHALCLCSPVPDGYCPTCPLRVNGCWLLPVSV